MRNIFLFFITITNLTFCQSIDDSFPSSKMKKDLAIFKDIRLKVNSGLYKYRTKQQIDSIYNWAENEIEKSSTYLEFYNIICKLTDFEGSCHNNTNFPSKYWKDLRKETYGYFPYPIKWIDGKWIVNFDNGEIPLGVEIISINQIKIDQIIENLYKYYTTDGINITGKRIGLRTHFARYFRWHYGLTKEFEIKYLEPKSNKIKTEKLTSISYLDYYKNFRFRYSKPTDQAYYKDLKENEKYNYKKIDSLTSVLKLNSFAIGGNAKSSEHLKFVKYLDSLFIEIKNNKVANLIVDIRNNSGGTDPNELVLYEYLSNRNFSENKSAWISFQKIPYIKYIETKVPRFLRPLGVIKYNKYFKKEFSLNKNGKFYQNSFSEDHKIRVPNKNAFNGDIYLLINPTVASAASNFGALLGSNDNTTIIGEETMGGYYGHNGHTPMSYILPNSKIKTTFSIVNLEQYVIKKPKQIYGRGIIPDFNINQTFNDYLNQEDTQINFVINLIEKNRIIN